MLKVGLTGNIGAGKTIVSKVFNTIGVPIFYADDIAKELTENDNEIKKIYIDWFGSDIFKEGRLNKHMLANIIFNDEIALQKVNSLIHPRVADNFIKWLKNYNNYTYVIFESAILFDSIFKNIMDKIILVTAPLELKIKRVIKRDRRNVEEIKQILSKQPNENLLIKLADYIIINDEKELIVPRIIEIHEELKKIAYSQN